MSNFWSDSWSAGKSNLHINASDLILCEHGWQWSTNQFTDFDLWFALDGHGELSINGEAHEVTAGSIICFPPGQIELHGRHDPNHPLRVFYCHFSLNSTTKPPTDIRFRHLPVDGLLWHSAKKLAELITQDMNSPQVHALLWQALMEFESTGEYVSDEPDQRIRAIAAELRERPAEEHRMSHLAAKAGLSVSQFRRRFHALFAASPVQYLIRKRIARSCYYLSETSQSIQMIADNLGYRDVYFFSRQFKEQLGESPSSWRKENLKL